MKVKAVKAWAIVTCGDIILGEIHHTRKEARGRMHKGLDSMPIQVLITPIAKGKKHGR